MKGWFYYLPLLTCLVLSLHVNAQSWQWAKRGGGNIGKGTGIDDFISNIATDTKGNSYVLAQVYSSILSGTIDIDGHNLGSGYDDNDVCLVSFDCAGNYRWSKMMGGRYSDNAYDIKTDARGGVYVSCFLNAANPKDSFSIANDTVVHAPTTPPYVLYKGFVVLKYDTAGVFQWMRMPEPDTLSTSNGSASFSMDVSDDGRLSLLLYAGSSGAFAGGGYVIPVGTPMPSMHILQYDADGNFINGFPLQITEGDNATLSRLQLTWDKTFNAFYLLSTNGGEPGRILPKFGTTKMTGTACLAKFSSSGTCYWAQQCSGVFYTNNPGSKPAVDKDGYVYIGFSDAPGTSFGGYTFTNTLSGPAMPSVLKIDPSTGAVVWGFNVNCTKGVATGSIAINDKNQVAFCGNGLGTIQCGSYTATATPTSVAVFMAVLNTTDGSVAGFDTLQPSSTVPNIMTSDANGNFYMGGTINSSVTVPGCGTLSKFGGSTDFFFVKYGTADCSSTAVTALPPIAALSVYPNPAHDYLMLSGCRSGGKVSLLNTLGQLLYSGTTAASELQLPLGTFVPGIYLLQYTDAEGHISSYKVIKE